MYYSNRKRFDILELLCWVEDFSASLRTYLSTKANSFEIALEQNNKTTKFIKEWSVFYFDHVTIFLFFCCFPRKRTFTKDFFFQCTTWQTEFFYWERITLWTLTLKWRQVKKAKNLWIVFVLNRRLYKMASGQLFSMKFSLLHVYLVSLIVCCLFWFNVKLGSVYKENTCHCLYLLSEVNINGNCPVGWGCRIHRLLLCRGVRSPNECPGYDTK